MMVRIILLALAILLLTACDGGRQDSRAAANPCDQMKDDAAAVDILEDQVEDLHGLVGTGGPVDPVDTVELDTVADSATHVARESLLVQKENLLSMATQSMQQNAMDCRTRSRPFDSYRTEPELEEGL